MSSRQEKLSELQNYIKEVDKEVTMILQSLQWERKRLLQFKPKSTCKFDSNHKVPQEKLEEHEAKCALKCQGYAKDDVFLPDVFDANSNTVLKLSSENIQDTINYASKTDPDFIRVTTNDQFLLAMKISDANVCPEPLTLERLQAAYTAHERRAIYDVVVHSRPSCGQLADLAVGEGGGPSQPPNKTKSELERLAELRDLRRRRAKYRVAARSCNYSHVLRGVIDAQMEMFTESQALTKSKSVDESNPTYRKVKEEQSKKRVDNPSDRNAIEHREFKKKKGDNQRRNNYDSDYNRKRTYDGHKSSRKKETNRYQHSTHERGKQYDRYDSYRGNERKQETFRGKVEKDLHQNITKEQGKRYDSDRWQERDSSSIKIEKDVHQSTTENGGKYYYNDRRKRERNREAYREETKKDLYQTSIEEKEKHYVGDSRQIRKRDTCREEMDSRKYGTSSNAERNRIIYVKEERDSSSSRDTQKFDGHRESEREKRSYEYTDRSSDRRKREHKHDDYEKYEKERENYHREKRKHKD